jgi:hypothetical protein
VVRSFDHVSHEWMIKFVKHRVADNRMLRLIQKWLKAGVSEDGEWSETAVGTPQGAVVSPLLANVYLALRPRLVGRGLAEEDRAGRRHHRSLRRPSCRRVSTPSGCGAVLARLPGAASKVWSVNSSGEDATNRVRALRGVRSTEARRREAGNLHVPRVHPLLWPELEGPLCGLAAHSSEATEGNTPRHQAGVTPEDA